jgi:hypothetical protein
MPRGRSNARHRRVAGHGAQDRALDRAHRRSPSQWRKLPGEVLRSEGGHVRHRILRGEAGALLAGRHVGFERIGILIGTYLCTVCESVRVQLRVPTALLNALDDFGELSAVICHTPTESKGRERREPECCDDTTRDLHPRMMSVDRDTESAVHRLFIIMA